MYKILAGIGAIATREKLGSSFYLELGVLLPLSEYRLEKEWSVELKSALSSFYFQTQRFRVKLADFLCMPCGGDKRVEKQAGHLIKEASLSKHERLLSIR